MITTNSINLENITSIHSYTSSYDLLSENLEPETWEAVSEDAKDFIMHVDDFEGISFLLFNYETVIVYDRTCGDIEGDPTTCEAMLDSLLDYYREEIAE